LRLRFQTRGPDGRWEARLRDKDGTRRLHHFYGRSRREVQVKLLTARRDRDRGKALASSRLTVGKFLEQWLNEVARQRAEVKRLSVTVS
jgi:hypothetical protein